MEKKSKQAKVVSFGNNDFYEKRAEEILAKAIHSFANHDYEYAINEFEVAKRLDPNNAEIYFYSAISKSVLEYEDAILDHKKAVELDPLNESYNIWYGISLYTNEKYEDSKRILESLYNEGSKEERVRNYLFRSMVHLEDFEGIVDKLAGRDYENELTEDEINSLGIAFHGLKKYERSIEVLNKISHIREYKVKTLHYICDSYTSLGMYSEALDYLDSLQDVAGRKFVNSYRKSIEFLKEINDS